MEKKIEVPKKSIGDHIHTAAQGVISAIPYSVSLPDGTNIGVGSPAQVLFNAIIQPPIQKRTEKWQEEITEAVNELLTNRNITIEDLQSNEKFISVLIEATIIAAKTHNQQKKDLLKNAVVNSAVYTTIDDERATLFVKYIDELIIPHILLLQKMYASDNELQKIEKFEELYKGLSSTDENKDTFKFLCEGLTLRGLVRISEGILDPNDLYETDGETFAKEDEDTRPKIKTTQLGSEFLKFVMSEDERASYI